MDGWDADEVEVPQEAHTHHKHWGVAPLCRKYMRHIIARVATMSCHNTIRVASQMQNKNAEKTIASLHGEKRVCVAMRVAMCVAMRTGDREEEE